MVSNKQLEANRENSQLGGVKTLQGKAVSKYNAQTHGILRNSLTDYEQEFYSEILEDLEKQCEPQGIIEQLLVERVAINYLKLFRVQKAETEFIQSKLNPPITKREGGLSFDDEILTGRLVVVEEGCTPRINNDNVQILMETYGRYETTIENRFFRALHELERAQKTARGEVQTPALDTSQMGSFSERGASNE